MPPVTVVTGFDRAGYELYGREMVRTFLRHWPADHRLVIYHEDMPPSEQLALPCMASLRTPPPEMQAFLKAHGRDPVARGLEPGSGIAWKGKDLKAGYSFRFDAVKFCKMAFYARDAGRMLGRGLLVWLDGDCISFADVPHDLVSRSLNEAACAYLGRDPYHPDAAFTCFRLPEALPILESWAGPYETGAVFRMREWHSAYVLRRAIGRAAGSGLSVRDLTPGAKKHVFAQAEIGAYVDHLKGQRRKRQGFSDERLAVRR